MLGQKSSRAQGEYARERRRTTRGWIAAAPVTAPPNRPCGQLLVEQAAKVAGDATQEVIAQEIGL